MKENFDRAVNQDGVYNAISPSRTGSAGFNWSLRVHSCRTLICFFVCSLGNTLPLDILVPLLAFHVCTLLRAFVVVARGNSYSPCVDASCK